MRRISGLVPIILLILPFWSCGGGGGSSSAPAVIYSGLLTQAIISVDNAMEFNSFLLGDGGISLPPTDETVEVPAMVTNLSNHLVSALRTASSVVLAVEEIPVSGEVPGLISGYIKYSGTVLSDGTATIVFTYVNFNAGDGYTYDGKVTVKVLSYDLSYDTILSATFSTNQLIIKGESEHLTLSGTASLDADPSANMESMTMDFDGRDENAQKTFRLEALESIMDCDDSSFPPESCTETVRGRIYLQDEGYVEISSETPLVYNYFNRFNIDVPDAGGPTVLSGAGNTREVIQPLSIVQVGIDIDSDGDGLYEQSDIYAWSDLVGLVITFETLQGTVNFDVANDGQETTDRGFVAVGWSNTMSEDGLDAYLVKTNGAGELEWAENYGGAGDQEFQSIVQTQDGGFAMIGSTISTDIPPVEHIYLVKTDAIGAEQWSVTYSGDISSNGYAVLENNDGSLMIAGNMNSWGPTSGTVGLGSEDIYLAKFEADGDLLWEKRMGGTDWDDVHALLQSADGGYVLTGTTSSFDYATLREEIYLIKADADGNLLWENHFDGVASTEVPLPQSGHDVVEDATGNLIVVGTTATLTYGNLPYLVKTTANGTLLWDLVLTDVNLLTLRGIALTASGNYILAGNDSFDVHLVEIDPAGDLVRDKTFNWGNFMVMCTANAIRTTADGGYAVFGSAWPEEGKDFYIIKTSDAGEL